MLIDWQVLRRTALRSESRAAVALLAGLALLLVPLPGPVLDALLALNLALALGLLLVAVLRGHGERLSSLPGWLVLSSFGRIAMAVGVARAVFGGGGAGSLVTVLGWRLTGGGGALLGGVVMAAILAVVAFMAIGLGVMRLAEVGARFALDALPGRQMALDSALTGGRIDTAEGLAQARLLEAGNAFYGAMDGAARFLRGEVTACIIVSALLPLAALNGQAGGLTESLAVAVGLATLLLVSAILAGAAAAVSLTSAAVDEESAKALTEVVLQPAAPAALAVVLLALALMPGMAKLPLVAVGGAAAAGAWWLWRSPRKRAAEVEPEGSVQLQLRLGLGLLSLTAGHDLPGFLAGVRTRLADEWGFALPPVTVSDDATLPPNDFSICLQGAPLAQGTLRAGRRLVVAVGEGALPAGGNETALPDGTQATWLREAEWERLPRGEYHLLEPLEVLAHYLQETLGEQAEQLLDRQRTTEWLAAVEMTHPASVAALARAGLGAAEVQLVGKALLAEGVPLRERVSLVEALAQGSSGGAGYYPAQSSTAGAGYQSAQSPGEAGYYPAQSKPGPDDIRPLQTAELLEAVRPALARTITGQVAVEGVAEVIELSGELEQQLLEQLERTGPALPPEQAERWGQTLAWLEERFSQPRRPAVILCHPRTRAAVARQIRASGARLRAITAAELLPLTRLQCKHFVKFLDPEPMMTPQVREERL